MDKHADIIPYTIETLMSICSGFFFKCIASIGFVLYTFAFDPLQEQALLAVLVLMIFDFATGLIAAKIKGEEIKSAKIFRSALKTLIYFVFIAAAHITEIAFPLIASYSDETIIAFLALTELVSIAENIGKMGFPTPQRWLNKLENLRDQK